MFDPFEGIPTLKITSFDKLAAWANDVKEGVWIWARNFRCKYVIIKIDTRRGAYSILDRDGHPITEEELFYQYRKGNPLPTPLSEIPSDIDGRALVLAQAYAEENKITDAQRIATFQLGAIEGLKKVSPDNLTSQVTQALLSARGWIVMHDQSDTARKDLKKIDDVLDLLGQKDEIPCTCLTDAEDDAYSAGGLMSGRRKPPACKAVIHKEGTYRG